MSKAMDLKPHTKVRLVQCSFCPFRRNIGLKLGVQKMGEIQTYLIQGINHFCHSDRTNLTICRGGRNYQLNIWHRLGFIEKPTDDALHSAEILMLGT